MKTTASFFLSAYLLFSIAGCAELNNLTDSLFTDKREESRQAQNSFDTQKSAIENRASAGNINQVQAAQYVRNLDRSFAGTGNWKFDSDDEEYYAYCIAMAERLDRKQITFAQYDALRTQRFSQIVARRQQINNSQPRSSSSTNCRSIRNADGSVSTNCNQSNY